MIESEKYVIVDTLNSFLHKDGYVVGSYSTLEEANNVCVDMLKKDGPRRICVCEIKSENTDRCYYHMENLKGTVDFKTIDVSKIFDENDFVSALCKSTLDNRSVEFFTDMIKYHNLDKCLNYLLFFINDVTNCVFCNIVINVLAGNISFLQLKDLENIHKTNDIITEIINICIKEEYLCEENIDALLTFVEKLHECDCLGYDRLIIDNIKKSKKHSFLNNIKRIRKIDKVSHKIYTEYAILDGDPLPSNWKIF